MFDDRLQLTITLTIAGDVFVIPAGSVRALGIDAKPYGFDASVAFVVSSEEEEDALFPKFHGLDRMDAKIALVTRPLDDPEDSSERLRSFSGIVVDRRVIESVSRALAGEPIFERRYEISLRDPLAVLWSEHRPLDLLVDASMRDMVERHKPAGVTIAYDFSRLDDRQDVLFVPLRGDTPASFYDYVVGFLDETGGVLEHAASPGTYRIGKKKTPARSPMTLGPHEVASLRIEPREPRRHVVRVLNPYADGKRIERVANPFAVTGARRDVVAYAMVAPPFERRVGVEKDRIRPGEHDVVVTLQSCPAALPTPGEGLELSEELGPTRYSSKKSYRVTSFVLRASVPVEQDVQLTDSTARFDLDVTIVAELASDPTPCLPRFTRLSVPVIVEGKVLSASGGDDDRTWFAAANDADGTWQLTCAIPLWSVDVVVPFEPGNFPGHFFFPPYKGQRVLVALERDSARIHGYLDWAANARTPVLAQGNRMALGYRDGNGTTVDHAYVDGKPALTIERKFAGDLERIELRDATVWMHVEERPSQESSEPKFDISPKVAAAKVMLASEVQGSIGKVTASFEGSTAAVSSSIEAASAEVDATLGKAETDLTARIEAIRAELSSMGETLGGAPAQLAAAAAEAKAEINAALEG